MGVRRAGLGRIDVERVCANERGAVLDEPDGRGLAEERVPGAASWPQ